MWTNLCFAAFRGALGVRDVTSFPGRPPPLPDSQRMVRYSGPSALLLRELDRQPRRPRRATSGTSSARTPNSLSHACVQCSGQWASRHTSSTVRSCAIVVLRFLLSISTRVWCASSGVLATAAMLGSATVSGCNTLATRGSRGDASASLCDVTHATSTRSRRSFSSRLTPVISTRKRLPGAMRSGTFRLYLRPSCVTTKGSPALHVRGHETTTMSMFANVTASSTGGAQRAGSSPAGASDGARSCTSAAHETITRDVRRGNRRQAHAAVVRACGGDPTDSSGRLGAPPNI
jgi:hypothetical protein